MSCHIIKFYTEMNREGPRGKCEITKPLGTPFYS